MERVHQDLMRDVTELQQQLQSSSQQLRGKKAELTRAEETIRREQQQILELVSLMTCSWILYNNNIQYTERDYQERAAVSAGQGQRASPGTATG